MRDTRVAFSAYWLACSPTRKRDLAHNAGLDIEYIGQIAAGRRRPSRWAAVSLVVATDHKVRPYSLRPDLWGYAAHLPPECMTALTAWRALRRDLSQLTNEG